MYKKYPLFHLSMEQRRRNSEARNTTLQTPEVHKYNIRCIMHFCGKKKRTHTKTELYFSSFS